MKKITAFILMVLCLTAFNSCSVDSKQEVTVDDAKQAYNDMKGTWRGKVTDENVPVEVTMTFGNEFTLSNLPVPPLLKRFFSGEKLDEALKTAHPANFVAPTLEMMISGDQVFVQMEPTDWSFTVTVGDEDYQVNALLHVVTLYSNNYKTLSASITVQELTCEGTTADLNTNGISYLVDSATRN